ncbi:hypothetical protein ACHWQZ_G007745 [Mnemiopsis leidyi]
MQNTTLADSTSLIEGMDIFLGCFTFYCLIIGTPANIYSCHFFSRHKSAQNQQQSATFSVYSIIALTDSFICMNGCAVGVCLLNDRDPTVFDSFTFRQIWGTVNRTQAAFYLFLVLVINLLRMVKVLFVHKIIKPRPIKVAMVSYFLFVLVRTTASNIFFGQYTMGSTIWQENGHHCFPTQNTLDPGHILIEVVFVSINIALPLLLIIGSTCVTVTVILHRRNAQARKLRNGTSRGRASRDVTSRATVTVLIFTAAYLFCNIPLSVTMINVIMSVYFSQSGASSVFYDEYARMLTFILLFQLNSAVNPLLYYLRIKSFRDKTRDVIETTSSGTEKKTRPAEKGTVSDLTLPAEQGDETGATQQTSVASTSSSEFSVVAATDFTMVPVHDIGGDEEDCRFVEYYGYIKIQCTAKNKIENEVVTYFKCPNSEVNYVMCGIMELECENYQSNKGEFTAIEDMHYHGKFLCGHAVCDTGRNNRVYGTDFECDEKCVNIPQSADQTCTKSNKTDTFACMDAPFESSHRAEVNVSKVCDGACDCPYCGDESSCNGYQYGHYCQMATLYSDPELFYLPLVALCDGTPDCADGSDESNCDENTFPTCTGRLQVFNSETQNYTEESVMRIITNRTRCAPFDGRGRLPFCDDFSDQLDCEDPSIAKLTCQRDGYTVTVANRMVCYDDPDVLPLCDNGLDRLCVTIDKTCTVHKHQLCDEQEDCPNGADETHVTCRDMSNHTCKRTLGGRVLRLPYSWIYDSYEDCETGADESESYPTCGETPATRRLKKTEDESCQEVFLCGHPPSDHIEFNDLCDKINTCDIENDLCHVALDTPQISQYIAKHEEKLVFPFCFKGLGKLAEVIGKCYDTKHTGFHGTEVLGRTSQVLRISDTTFDCNYLYGEAYVYMSCIGNCSSSETKCPMQTALKHDSCPGQYQSCRVYTLANNDYLTFLLPGGGGKDQYHNNLFSCRNDKCISYDKVCNLVNDCGDFSDEELCTNHFKCASLQDYIPLSSKCDERVDCQDFSDECNDQCSVRIIENVALEIAAWILGSLATLFNSIIIFRGFPPLKKAYSSGVLTFSMRVFILLIATGDLLVGLYLLTISSYHHIYYHRYCAERFEWLTSLSCAVIGVVSTIGSKLSLFSMTFLSLMRALRMSKLSVGSRKTSKREVLMVLLVGLIVLIISCSIAAAPLSEHFEDFFVNGINYPGNPLMGMVGSVTKAKHFKIFDKYYGRLRTKDLSWKHIDKLAMGMFSQEYSESGIPRNQVHFYGNAGVCLFKYFVTPDDPQKTYVWCVLLVNISCFAAITIAYIVIQYISNRSSAQVTQNQGNKKLTRRNQKLQRKITLIIGTNFCCWIPFVIMCCLHSSEVINASRFYSLFSLIVLPINSVLNPLLYDDTIAALIKKIRKRSTEQVRSIFSGDTTGQDQVVERRRRLLKITTSKTQTFFNDFIPLREAKQAVKAETIAEENSTSSGRVKTNLVRFNVLTETVKS